MLSDSAEKLAEALTRLGSALRSAGAPGKYSDQWGWQGPALDRNDLAFMAEITAEKIRAVAWDGEDKDGEFVLNDLAPKVESALAQLPNIQGGYQGPAAIADFLQSVDMQVESIIKPSQLVSASAIPAAISRQVTTTARRLQEATQTIDGIEAKVKQINDAHGASSKLDITMSELEAAIRQITGSQDDAARSTAAAAKSADDTKALLSQMELTKAAAADIMVKINDAYRATTSQGLASAFAAKAQALNSSLGLWFLALIVALAVAGYLAHERFPMLLAAVGQKPDWGLVLVHVVLAALTLGPPIWVAWVATKQIGQRFRLAEDYGYKAALSAAYEGYRNEAAGLDPLFRAQLFSTALTRLDELPLRLVEQDVHGSPLHELLKSAEFKEKLKDDPTLVKRVIDLLRPTPPAPPASPSPSANP